ncbi:hypothetical protein OUZ56_010448 [Daphnia magna]|uniref:Retrotransposon gag domain-containing protein n=1 Tax=Daphnia magna TaxID=35525 RepID=A0ABR0AIP5_9CRUS|nr:hypothetical protein OUZ56_010448 [Daphnia magna]
MTAGRSRRVETVTATFQRDYSGTLIGSFHPYTLPCLFAFRSHILSYVHSMIELNILDPIDLISPQKNYLNFTYYWEMEDTLDPLNSTDLLLKKWRGEMDRSRYTTPIIVKTFGVKVFPILPKSGFETSSRTSCVACSCKCEKLSCVEVGLPFLQCLTAKPTSSLSTIVIQSLGGEFGNVDTLLQQLKTVNGKEKEFLIKVNTVLQEEALAQQVAEKKRTDEISLENFNLQKQIAKKEKNPNQLTEKIIESNEFFKNSLEKTYQRISELEQILRKNTENEEYLKKLLKKKEETTAHVETEGQENINKLQNENKLLLESYNTVKKHEKAQKERSDELEKEESKIQRLEERLVDYKQKEAFYIEAESSANSRTEEHTGEVSKLIEQINDLTSIKSQNKTIELLQKQNELRNKEKPNFKIMGVDHDTSEEAETSRHNPIGKSTEKTPTAEEIDMIKTFTQPIVKVLGELFSREDKKSIPPYKGKSTDKMIMEWLKTVEHVARNNNCDDTQKLRFFSDKLKGEALDWHEEYVSEKGDELEYDDWRSAIIARFQDAYDLATLKKKLLQLKQKPEENCKAFVSRLNNLYDGIEGKEEKLDHNKTVVEDQLLSKVKKMRDTTKIKILIQGILPKIKTELYLRMPEDANDFDALCKQLFISEQILQNKENNDDKELTAVIAGIAHHGKQQDFEIEKQPLTNTSLADHNHGNTIQDHSIREYDLTITSKTAANQATHAAENQVFPEAERPAHIEKTITPRGEGKVFKNQQRNATHLIHTGYIKMANGN